MFEKFDSAMMIVGDLEGVSGRKNGNIECQFRNVDANEGLDRCCGHEKPSLQIRAGVKPPWRLFGFEATKKIRMRIFALPRCLNTLGPNDLASGARLTTTTS